RSLIPFALTGELKAEIDAAAAILAADPLLSEAVARYRAVREPHHSGRDPLLFAARALRLIREIAEIYGQRPGLAGTVHLLRRLASGAGMVGAVDLVGGILVQQLGGAIVERLSASAAESAYAAQKMARLGIIAMALCRPGGFRPGQVSSLRGLVSGLLKPVADKAG